MRNVINTTHIEGKLYEHNLTLKTSGPNSKAPGTEFITGTVSVATDDACTNVVSVHFTYVTAITAKGGANATFNLLKSIIDKNTKSIMEHGADEANYIRIDSAIGLNEFYSDRSGKEELVSAKRNEGGFVHPMAANDLRSENERNTFKCNMLITGVTLKEADEEKGLAEKAIVKGAIFDFRKSLLPVEFSVSDPGGIDYFMGLGASQSEPVFTRLQGRLVSEVVTRTVTEESAFGEPSVREVKNTRKDYVVTWGAKEPYVWDDESTMTAAEVNEAMKARELTLAAMKTRQDEYKASKGAVPAKATVPTNSSFNF